MQKNRHRFVFLPAFLFLLVAVTCVRSVGRANDPVPGTGGMAEILTPTDGFDFSSFVQTACTTVRQKWYAVMPEDARLGRKGRVVVRFRINKDGALPNGSPALEESSGRKDLDGAALSAIRARLHSNSFLKSLMVQASTCGLFFSTTCDWNLRRSRNVKHIG